MHSERTDRGFVRVLERMYPPEHPLEDGSYEPLLQESSMAPCGSYLWIGDHHHLNREQVKELIKRMKYWLKTGRLAIDKENNLGN